MKIPSPFAAHVAQGLTAPQAYLSSRFIYDERGSRLFQQIMQLDEYYLTRCEFEILKTHAAELYERFSRGGESAFELIELGAGDGTKTKLLLDEFVRREADVTYRPVDISADILEVLSADLSEHYPSLKVDPIATTYLDALDMLNGDASVRRVVLFMGSNIGNFSLEGAREFCGQVCSALNPGDLFVIGADLRKDPRQIREAYDDAKGVTASFNLNLLHRLRSELGAEVDVDAWRFYPLYNPETGEVRSYLYPTSSQRICMPSLDIDRVFEVGECIHTEVSRKYTLAELNGLATDGDCRPVVAYRDSKGWFADVVWERG